MSDFVSRLRSLDACAVSDALDALNLPGVADGLSAMSTPRRIAGRVITVQLVPADGHPPARHLCSAAVEAGDPDAVIVIDHAGRDTVAGWGGILSRAAVRHGVAGVIIDGAARDLDESRELDLAIYARAGTPRTARGRIVERDWNIPVSICGVSVSPDDLVIADASGVVFVPQARAEQVITLAESVVVKEARMAADVATGMPVSQVMGRNYETMLLETDR